MADERRQALLVLRSQAGDQDAFDELLAGLQEPLFGYLRRLTGDPELAKDILQEVFLLIWRKLRWLREPEALPALVLPHRVARRLSCPAPGAAVVKSGRPASAGALGGPGRGGFL